MHMGEEIMNKKKIHLYENEYGILGHLYKHVLMNPERIAFTLHRITGIGMVLYLVLHVYMTSLTLDPLRWASFLTTIENPLVRFGEWLLAGAVIYHGLNGIRLILTEALGIGLGKPRRKAVYPLVSPSIRAAQRKSLYLVFALSLVGWIIAGYIIFSGG